MLNPNDIKERVRRNTITNAGKSRFVIQAEKLYEKAMAGYPWVTYAAWELGSSRYYRLAEDLMNKAVECFDTDRELAKKNFRLSLGYAEESIRVGHPAVPELLRQIIRTYMQLYLKENNLLEAWKLFQIIRKSSPIACLELADYLSNSKAIDPKVLFPDTPKKYYFLILLLLKDADHLGDYSNYRDENRLLINSLTNNALRILGNEGTGNHRKSGDDFSMKEKIISFRSLISVAEKVLQAWVSDNNYWASWDSDEEAEMESAKFKPNKKRAN